MNSIRMAAVFNAGVAVWVIWAVSFSGAPWFAKLYTAWMVAFGGVLFIVYAESTDR